MAERNRNKTVIIFTVIITLLTLWNVNLHYKNNTKTKNYEKERKLLQTEIEAFETENKKILIQIDRLKFINDSLTIIYNNRPTYDEIRKDIKFINNDASWITIDSVLSKHISSN